MNQQVGIVTDTVACLSPSVAGDLGIAVVRVHLLIDDHDLVDGELPLEEFYERAAAARHAGTATPPPRDFLSEYEGFFARGMSGVVALTVSGALSNVSTAAALAARDAPGPVEVVDTRTVASAQGLIARRMAELAIGGASLDELVAAFAELRERVGLVAMVPDLGHLAAGGRVPRVVAAIGDRLDVKPLIRIGDDGEAHASGLVRSLENGIERMVDRAVDAAGTPGSRIVVMHVLAEDRARAIAASVAARVEGVEVEIAPFTAVLGLHTGPGLVGLAWEAAPTQR